MLRRIHELAAETAADHIPGQHVLTKAILRRFASASGPDKGLSIRSGSSTRRHATGSSARTAAARSRTSSPLHQDRRSGCGRRPRIKLHDALAAVDNGTLLDSPAHMATIKDVIALHYVPSSAARLVHIRTWVRIYAASRARWLTNWRWLLEEEFYRAKGLYAPGDQALSLFLEQVMQPSIDRAVSGRLFRVRVEDRAGQFTAGFNAVLSGAGIEVVKIPPRGPRANAFAERWVRTAEVTDRMLIAGSRHLRAVLDEYVAHYNHHRPHRARNLRPPDCDDITMATTTDLTAARIRRRRVLGGLIHEYERAA